MLQRRLQIIVNECLFHCFVLEGSKECSLTSCLVQEFCLQYPRKGGSSFNLSTLRLRNLLLREAVYFPVGYFIHLSLNQNLLFYNIWLLFRFLPLEQWEMGLFCLAYGNPSGFVLALLSPPVPFVPSSLHEVTHSFGLI